MKINPEMLKSAGEELDTQIAKLEAEVFEEAGTTFNINSPNKVLAQANHERVKSAASAE